MILDKVLGDLEIVYVKQIAILKTLPKEELSFTFWVVNMLMGDILGAGKRTVCSGFVHNSKT